MLRQVFILTFIYSITNAVHAFNMNIIEKALSLHVSEEPRLQIIELVEKCGYKCERYDVVTEDGYILGLYRVNGEKTLNTCTILLLHGIFDSSDTWIIRGNLSLGLTLAEKGCDVWLGNMRGNKHSRNHLSLNPNYDKEFWRFGLDEIGLKDTSAFIDFILNKTGQSQLYAIGHSEGTAAFSVLCSTKQQYNSKIKVLIQLAPIKYLRHIRGVIQYIMKAGPELDTAFEAIHLEELLPNRTAVRPLLEFICSNGVLATVFCEDVGFGPLFGHDNDEYHDFLSMIFGYYPAGSSRQNVKHFIQIYQTDKFSMYDYGAVENLKKYHSTVPPVYDFNNIKVPVALLYGKNDYLADPEDVERLNGELPNVILYKAVDHEKMNHIDFIWGKHTYQYLFPSVFELLNKYGANISND